MGDIDKMNAREIAPSLSQRTARKLSPEIDQPASTVEEA